jgi:DNA sulfur modification protein DndB
MRAKKKYPKLLLPAIRAHMGDWFYYVSVLKMRDAADRVSYADEIHESKTLNDLLQRRLTERSKTISDYLLGQHQRLFNAMVIGVYEGNPSFAELALQHTEHVGVPFEQSEALEGMLGYLVLDGSERLFAIDGQHRIVGIREALSADPKLAEEEVSVIFVGHSNTADGKKRTRRLFTTLNRYAKPVSKGDIILLDEDDIVAIVTRLLVEVYPKFRDCVAISMEKNLKTNDVKNLTSIVGLYDALDFYLASESGNKWASIKRFRPSEDEIEAFYDAACGLFDLMVERFGELRRFSKDPDKESRAKRFRHEQGGNLLFRPIGLEVVVKAITLMKRTLCLEEAVDRASGAPLELSKWPWVGLLWEQETERMIPANKGVAEKLLYYGLMGDLSPYRAWDENRLRKELAAKLNTDPKKVKLQRFS